MSHSFDVTSFHALRECCCRCATRTSVEVRKRSYAYFYSAKRLHSLRREIDSRPSLSAQCHNYRTIVFIKVWTKFRENISRNEHSAKKTPCVRTDFSQMRDVSCNIRQRSIHETICNGFCEIRLRANDAWKIAKNLLRRVSEPGIRNLGELSRHLRRNSSRSNRSLVIKLRIGFQLYELALGSQSGLQEVWPERICTGHSPANYPFSLKRFFLRLARNFSCDTKHSQTYLVGSGKLRDWANEKMSRLDCTRRPALFIYHW